MAYEQNPNKIGRYFIRHRAEPRQRGDISYGIQQNGFGFLAGDLCWGGQWCYNA